MVIFAPGSAQISSISSVPIEPRRDMVLRFNGRLVWNEDRTVRVFAPFGGRVSSIAVRPGDRVKAGQTLAVLAAPELGVVQAEARKAEQDSALAQKNLARVQELYNAGVAPAKDLQAAQADVARTGARFVCHVRDPLADLVLVQRVALARARARGLDPDNPRSLTRSVMLDAAAAS